MDKPQAVLTYDAPTVMKGRRYLMRPNSELVFHGGQFPRHRRQFVVTSYGDAAPSVNATRVIQIRSQETGIFNEAAEPDDGFCVFLRGVESITLFTNATIIVRNPSDSISVSVTICEIFYV